MNPYFAAAALVLAGAFASGLRGADAPFVLGADVSALDSPAPRASSWGALPPYQENGVPADEVTILHRHGWNAFRIRVFVAPVRQAPANTVEAAIPLACEVKRLGATFLLDLHFSDTWADPQHQDIPVAWRGLDIDELARAWEAHAYETVKRLKEAGAMPDWVQIGNEITRGAAWPLAQVKQPGSAKFPPPEPYDDARQWDHLIRLIQAGIRGVKAAAGPQSPRIAIHIDQGASWAVTRWYFDHLEQAHVPYDIIAQSFYPEWNHGTIAEVEDNMRHCAARYGKPFLIVETGYAASHVPNNTSLLWPVTPEGRLSYLEAIVTAVRKGPNGLGVMYWAPERQMWNRAGTPGPGVDVLDRLNGAR
ncbi:MAG TPA: glycosyl hydrolase 53 family protein [Opitutaceae bacterium]|jgi:arabinogalactan endo-1,4-beta-galactosidase|nr:glycosyl hydrolase 53 family protein [Opitutaceae bacterium]